MNISDVADLKIVFLHPGNDINCFEDTLYDLKGKIHSFVNKLIPRD